MYGTLISSVTVGAGGAASIDFTSIPQTYTDLVCVISSRAASGVTSNQTIFFNSDTTAANYTTKRLYGTPGSGAATSSSAGYPHIGASSGDSATASTFGNIILTIPNYTGSTNKSFSSDAVAENNAADTQETIVAGIWNNTAAITALKIQFAIGGVNLMQNSTAYLYGLTKGSGGATVS